jgi:dynein heavy chain 1
VQINYADMLKRVEPLRDELHSLEVQAQENKNHGEEVTNLIIQLEHSIASYKEEYAQLISQAQAIKTDLENVQAKVWIQDLVPIIADVIRYPIFV